MKKILGRLAIALIALVVLAVGYIYAASEWMLRRKYDEAPQPLAALASPTEADLAEGERLSMIVGCWAGCHGKKGEGGTEEAPGIFEATAPTMSDVLPQYSDAELVRLIRLGIKRDGRTAIGMISGTFYPLGDADLARIIAHLRRQPASTPVPRVRGVEFVGRLALALGEWHTSAGEVDRSMPRWGELPRNTAFERGRYLVSITCTECHGLDLQGKEYLKSPALDIVKAYQPDQFAHLMRTGEPTGGRELGMMAATARAAFSHFTDEEIGDLYAYLVDYRKGPPTRNPAASTAAQ